jgi:hypothetical protein
MPIDCLFCVFFFFSAAAAAAAGDKTSLHLSFYLEGVGGRASFFSREGLNSLFPSFTPLDFLHD